MARVKPPPLTHACMYARKNVRVPEPNNCYFYCYYCCECCRDCDCDCDTGSPAHPNNTHWLFQTNPENTHTALILTITVPSWRRLFPRQHRGRDARHGLPAQDKP
eukprot:349722-Chlamydomonas_euryale.AAC.1